LFCRRTQHSAAEISKVFWRSFGPTPPTVAAITQEIEGDAGDFRGHDGIRRWWSDLHDLYDGLRSDVVEVRDLGERVVVVYVVQGRAKGSGLVFEDGQTLAQVVRLRHGKITEVRDYSGRSEALEAVGLRE
jgi:ketosteroid isomerase-like protein